MEVLNAIFGKISKQRYKYFTGLIVKLIAENLLGIHHAQPAFSRLVCSILL
jgi:hypothetical protein